MTAKGKDDLRGRQVVFLASIDWDAAWQRHQVLASCFARNGCEVFFVENTGFRDFQFADAGRITHRLLSALLGAKASRHMHHIPRGLRLISPLVLPPTHSLFRLANRYWFLPRLVR
ncbi:MAG: hypothetical protein ABIJ96_01230, partial [Elusimicrobiota bacterium]